MERGCVRSTSRSGSSEACVLGAFHRLCAFERAAAGPSDTAAVRWKMRPTGPANSGAVAERVPPKPAAHHLHGSRCSH